MLGSLGAVVEHLEVERAHALGSSGQERHPDVADHAGALDVREDHPLAGAAAPGWAPLCGRHVPGRPRPVRRRGSRTMWPERPASDRCRRDSRWGRSRVLRRVGVDQRLAAFVHPRPIGRNRKLDRGGLVLSGPRPPVTFGAVGMGVVQRSWMVEAHGRRPPSERGRRWTCRCGSTTSRMCTRGSSPRCEPG